MKNTYVLKNNINNFIVQIKLRSLKQISIIFQHVLISFLVFRVFVVGDSLSLKGSPAAFGKMIDGTASRPFVLRTLLPSTIKIIRDQMPESLKSHIKLFFETRRWFVEYLRTDKVIEYSIALTLSFIFFLGFSFVLLRLAKYFYQGEPFLQHIVVFAGMLIIPLCSAYGHYIYDPATLFLFSLGLLLVVEEYIIPMLFLFPLLVLNKETSVLLIPVFIIYQFRRMPIKKIFTISFIMSFIWLLLRIIIMRAYEANPGTIAEFHLFDHNLRLFANPVAALFFLTVIVFLGVLIFNDWKSKQAFLRSSFLVVFCPLSFLSIFFGYLDELREFYEVVPFVALLIAPTISKLM